MRRTHCGGCGADQLEVFLDLGKTPLADRFPATPDEPEDTWPLEVAVCRACWLVQLLEVVPDELLFGADYGFYSSTSPSKVAEHEALAAELLAAYPDQAKRLTVEIACNDGDLLRHFQDAGRPAIGVDPADGPAAVARDRGLDVLVEPFGRVAAYKLRDDYGPAGLVIARNVAAHVADLDDFFGGIAELLAPDGVAVVEVQYLADLLAGNQFDHVYHEHRFYFSVGSLEWICGEHGLRVRSVTRTPQQGGSIRAVIDHDDPSNVIAVDFRLFLNEQRYGLRDMAVYESFQGRVEYVRDRLNDLLASDELTGATLAGYGATAKSCTLLNYLEAGPHLFSWVEDTTPAKIGRYTPGTHIPILAPDPRRRPDAYMLLLWNDLAGVLRRERAFLDGGGRFLAPIPIPVLL